jgi:hypothetical protein
VVSTFPLDQTHAIYGKVEELLIQKGLKDAVGGKTFDAQSPAQSIDFFSVHQGVQPMVLDSIIQPISKYWNEHNSRPATRQSLLQDRRPRYLYESIPASDKPKQDILMGFFVAKALKLIKVFLTMCLLLKVRSSRFGLVKGQSGLISHIHCCRPM